MMLSVVVFGDHYSVDPFDVAEVKLFFNVSPKLGPFNVDFTNYKYCLHVLFWLYSNGSDASIGLGFTVNLLCVFCETPYIGTTAFSSNPFVFYLLVLVVVVVNKIACVLLSSLERLSGCVVIKG